MTDREMMELGEKQARFDYQIASGDSPQDLCKSVMGWRKKGYRPVGGLVVHHAGPGSFKFSDSFFQAVVRE